MINSFFASKSIFFILIVLLFKYEGLAQNRVYVSSSIGDDKNNGFTESSPVRTIDKALSLSSIILLKAGDIFYSKGIRLKGKTLTRYGEGPNPTICGFKRIIIPKWEKVEDNIWRINLIEDNYTGVLLTGSSISNNIGCLHEYDKDLLHGRKVQFVRELKNDWDVWQTERHERDIPPTEFNWVYLYYSGNPNDLMLEFSIADVGIKMEASTLEGINVKGYGYGISMKSNSCVKDCWVDAIGGHIHVGNVNYTCNGNGIDIYVSRDISNCVIENCIVSRCYDCGMTIQGVGNGQATPRNIKFVNNLIYDCCQGWEDYLRNDENVRFENCVFEENTVLNSGHTAGFGYPDARFKYCHVLGNNKLGNKGMIIRNNTFIGGNYYCSGAYQGFYQSNVWEGNTCVIERGDFILSNYTGSKDVIRIPTEKGDFRSLRAATDDAIRRYRELTGDQTTHFIIRNNRRILRQIRKQKNNYFKHIK